MRWVLPAAPAPAAGVCHHDGNQRLQAVTRARAHIGGPQGSPLYWRLNAWRLRSTPQGLPPQSAKNDDAREVDHD